MTTRHWTRIAAALAATALALIVVGGSGASPMVKTIVVNTTADGPDTNPKDGVCKAKFTMLTKPGTSYCSLRAAIQTVDFAPRGTYTIKLPAGTMHLSVHGAYEDKAAKGDLDVLQANVTLIGQGPAKTTIDGGGIDRVFDVSAFAGLTVRGVTITGGKSNTSGGAISVSGTLRLQNVFVENSNAPDWGGAIHVTDTGGVDLQQVTIAHNVAGLGAGIRVDGNIDMTNVTLVGNNASQAGGGLHVGQNGKASLLHVTITGNTSGSGYQSISVGGPNSVVTMQSSIVTGTCYLVPGPHFPHAQQNVLTSSTCGDDQPVPDAGLLSLAAQGNVVPTVALTSTSPAVDFAFSGTCPPVDARGVKRPQGAGCDSGAYELVKP